MYTGFKYGGLINAGLIAANFGGSLNDTKPFVTLGLSFGTEKVRLETDVLYDPAKKNEHLFKAGVYFRF